ncbi:MAG: hypothetical protein Q7T18_08515, partial [Sedimentisphaerales bacterium]|nr:hypothetical protein [Sedimentisphaerales bacterium]
MSSDLDLNDVVASFAANIVERGLYAARESITNYISKHKIPIREGLQNYARDLAEKISFVRTILSENPAYIRDIYVPVRIKKTRGTFGPKRYSANEFVEATLRGERISSSTLVVGTAGSGKSIYIKSLCLDRIYEGRVIPILIELRELRHISDDIISIIMNRLKAYIPYLNDDLFSDIARMGKFEILLDGLDELERSRRSTIVNDVYKFVTKYKKVNLIITTRPDDREEWWPYFDIGYVDPMTLNDVVLLIEKSPYDQELKSQFIEQLGNGLFEDRQDLLTIPLLA